MKLYYFSSPSGIRNFGDDLNPWIWSKLIPDLLNEDETTLFVGIGTLLNNYLETSSKKIVFSSGAGYGQGLPVIDDSWEFYCVRGPLTAEILGLDKKYAVTDGAMLLRDLYIKDIKKKYKYSYMPHVMMAVAGANSWKQLCDDLDIGYIDPRMKIEDVFDMILETEILITEAMHGAIVAESFSVPWIPVISSKDILSFKWRDWCGSLNVEYHPSKLYPLWDTVNDISFNIKAKHWVKYKLVRMQMRHIVDNVKPFRPKEALVSGAIVRLNEALCNFKSKYNNYL